MEQITEKIRLRANWDLRLYGQQILNSEELRRAHAQTHHHWSTVGEHTLRVAMTSLTICYALKKMNVEIHVPDVVVGSLCHDLGILDRYQKYANDYVCSKEHAADSVKVAKQLVPDLSDLSKDIIERHMWPVSGKMPNSKEALIVSLADKYCAVKDFVAGCQRNGVYESSGSRQAVS